MPAYEKFSILNITLLPLWSQALTDLWQTAAIFLETNESCSLVSCHQSLASRLHSAMKTSRWGKTAVFFCFTVTKAYGITWWQFTAMLLRNSLFWQQTKVSLCLLFRIQEVGFKLGQTQNHMFWHHFNTCSVKEGHLKNVSKPIQYEPYSSRLWKHKFYTFCLQLLGSTTTCEKGI